LLNLYKSNKIEVISELLAEELKICPPAINEKLEIVVPNYFLGNWLREQITIKNKISALYEFKTISTMSSVSGLGMSTLFVTSNFKSLQKVVPQRY